MNDYVIFDCESQKLAEDVEGGWSNVYGHGLSSCVTYDSKTDNYTFWDHKSREKLCKYLNGKITISFNGIMYDSKLLLGDKRIIDMNGSTRNDKYSWNNIDIYVEIFRNIFKMDKTDYPKILETMKIRRHSAGIFALEDITRATLNCSKSGEGAMAPVLFQEGRIVELFQYNLQDVRILKKLFDFIRERKYIVTGTYDIVRFM